MLTAATAPFKTETLIDSRALLRLPQVLRLIPMGRTKWWEGVKDGRYPKPIRLGPRTVCWKAGDIFALLDRLSENTVDPK